MTTIILAATLAFATQAVHANGPGEPPGDPVPNPVFDLAVDLVVSPPTESTITLTWSAPSDSPGMLTIAVAAKAYDLRWSTAGPIEDETAWIEATPAAEAGAMTPQDPDQPETLTVALPLPGTRYWFALKSEDAITGLWSALSTTSPDAWTLAAPDPSPAPPPPAATGEASPDEGGCSSSAAGSAGFLGLAAALLARRR